MESLRGEPLTTHVMKHLNKQLEAERWLGKQSCSPELLAARLLAASSLVLLPGVANIMKLAEKLS